ncbi:unnamed protein product [Diabrotica balteata]|uniref:Uncharacterized protein n=1 Tax=Diabrotica balteata TaxID=107213 RepID=A0A9N9T650_DIABA|nr:unnamed protein product [Diabrotica balteata]
MLVVRLKILKFKPKAHLDRVYIFLKSVYIERSFKRLNCQKKIQRVATKSLRKWLPPPLRKLSQGKVDKAQANTPPPLKKTGSDKRIKCPRFQTTKKSREHVEASLGVALTYNPTT